MKREDKQSLKVDEHHKDHLEDAFDEAQVLVVWRVDDGEGAEEPRYAQQHQHRKRRDQPRQVTASSRYNSSDVIETVASRYNSSDVIETVASRYDSSDVIETVASRYNISDVIETSS